MVAKNKFLEFGDGLAAAAMIAAEAASLHRRERARQIPAKTMWPAILLTMGEARAIAGTPGKDAWIGRVAIRHRRRFALHGGLPESCTRKLRLPLSNWRRSWRGERGRNADRGLSRAGGAGWTGGGRDLSLHRRRCRGFCRPCRDRDAIAKRLPFAAREFRPIAFDDLFATTPCRGSRSGSGARRSGTGAWRGDA